MVPHSMIAKVKLDGYAYCSQAVELAEKGEFRESAQAASKALHVALQTGNKDLLGKAYRDLAIAFSYGGQLERAEQFANLALKYPAKTPPRSMGRRARFWAMCVHAKPTTPRLLPCTNRHRVKALIASARWSMPHLAMP